MHVATITCRFDPALGTFDDQPLRTFTRDKVVLSVRDHFHTQGEVPHLTFVLVYRLIPPSQPDGSSGRLDPERDARQGRDRQAPTAADLRATLPPDARARFDLLRDWRNRTAQDEAVPAYVVLTNKQLIELARLGPTTRKGLERVQGLGRKKADRYAAPLLGILGGGPAAPAPAEPASPVEGAP